MSETTSYYRMYEKPLHGHLYDYLDYRKKDNFKTDNILDGLEDFDPKVQPFRSNLDTVTIMALEQDAYAFMSIFDTYCENYADERRDVKTIDTRDVYGRTALQWIIGARYFKGFTRLLEKKVDVNYGTLLEGFTPLMVACRQGGDIRFVKELITHGADIHKKAHSGATAFHIATASGSRDCMRLLVMNGADPKAMVNGKHSLDLAKDDKTRKVVHTCMRSCIIREEKENAVCAFCEQPSKELRRCGECYVVFYCTQACQIKHWIQHRKTCASNMIAKIDEGTNKSDSKGSEDPAPKQVDIQSHDKKTFFVEAYACFSKINNTPTEFIKVINPLKKITARIVPDGDEDVDFKALLNYVVTNGEGNRQSVYFWAKFANEAKTELLVYHGNKLPRYDAEDTPDHKKERKEQQKKKIRSSSLLTI
uniref:Uncharacterized protein LOC100177353 n=1 Tax=Phallusia mammillata TaxID=59560 RepID=A0A6F9DFZ2_9ASCI|nr:uncharacterized protein LOC100177353 [Phallusia mammillata]